MRTVEKLRAMTVGQLVDEIYNDNWIKGGFDTMKTFLTNVGMIVSNYESRFKIK